MIDRRKFKGMNLIKVGLESIRIELLSLDDYIDETANTLKKKQKKLEKEYESARKESPEDTDEIDDYFSDEHYRYHEMFPTFTFNSILVSQFSFFENRLKFLCELHQRKSFSNVKISDLGGTDIEKCRRYLTLVAEIDFSTFQDTWKRITDIQKLRNAIIHNSAKVESKKQNENILSIIKNDDRIEYSENNEKFFINDVDFLKEFSALLLSFFSSLVNILAVNKVVARNTTMPFNNASWGKEKTETLLKEIIQGIRLIEETKLRNDEYKYSDLEGNIKEILSSMAWDLTKLYSFFSDGEWKTEDRDLIIQKGQGGLDYLKEIYNKS